MFLSTISLEVLDLIVIALYFVFVFGIAIWVTIRERSRETSSGYFLAGRNLGWFVIGASLFASNIGSEHLIGLAGSGFAGGVAVAQYEIWAGIILLLLGWVFVPFYLKSGVYTMPEFLERRYSRAARTYLSMISIIAYVLTKISVTIFAGGVVFEAIGVNFWMGALVLVIATGLYTIFGGLKAVIYTDMIQMFVLFAGSIVVTFFGLKAVGGWEEMYRLTLEGGGGTDSNPYFEIWKPLTHPDFPWTGILFGAPILGVWYWCTDQFIVQRVLSAKNIDNARKGTIFSGYLKMLPLFLFVLPGILAFAISQKGLLDMPLKADGTINSNATLPIMVKSLLPTGLRGLVVAGLFAALMSSLSSVFNSCSTLITLDFYKKYKPHASEKQLVVVGQVATAVLVGLGLLWIPFISKLSDQLFIYLQSVQAYISPPIAAVFLLGVFFKRLNGHGAMAALVTGFILGMFRFILEIFKDHLAQDSFLYSLATINFLHIAILLFVICVAVLVVVSLTTAPPDESQTRDITFEPSEAVSFSSLISDKDFWLSLGLFGVIVAMWITFNG
ncbi:MAG: sodium:solute symporter [Bacteroidota bacterium]